MGVRWLVLAGVAVHAFTLPLTAQSSALGEVETIGSGPTTLLVIPCASCRWRSFEEFAERNADRFTTIAVTLPGYGGTALPALPSFSEEPLWHDHAVRALGGLLEELDLTDVIVVGHSFGSSIALQLAGRWPDRIRGLVNLDGTLVGPLERAGLSVEERVSAAQEIREEFMEPLADPDEWQRINLPSIDRQDRRILYHGWFMATELTAMTQYWWDNLLIDRNPILQALDIPVLDVQLYGPGVRNPAAAKARYEERVDALGLGGNYSVLFYENVGHFIMEDAPELLDELLGAFAEGNTDRLTGTVR